MTRLALLILAMLALAACDPGARTPAAPSGGAGDPSSPAYFRAAVGDRVLFVVDEATLSPQARQTLDAQARWLGENGTYTAVIEGHADEQGTRDYNLALGARRAAAVKEYLVARGVADDRLDTVTFGKERPIEICSEESCYERNRRAVTVIAQGAGA